MQRRFCRPCDLRKPSETHHFEDKKRGQVCSGPTLCRHIEAMALPAVAARHCEDRTDFAAAQADIGEFAIAQTVEFVDDGIPAARVPHPAAEADDGGTEGD